jgi:hypothetical protein
MSAMLAEFTETEPTLVALEIATPFARGINTQNQRRCPHCDSIIYSRRTCLCGVCNKALPETLLFNAEQAQRVSSLLSEERQRHRAWLRRANFGS